MSYDLYFWRQRTGCTVPPASTMRQLIDGDVTNHTVPLPIDDIRREIAAHFPQAELNRSRSGDLEQLVVELPDGSCATVEWSEHYFCVGSHRCTGDTLNTFIDIAEKYGAYLFDPQSGRRYGGE